MIKKMAFSFQLLPAIRCERCNGELFWEPRKSVRKKFVCGRCLNGAEASEVPELSANCDGKATARQKS